MQAITLLQDGSEVFENSNPDARIPLSKLDEILRLLRQDIAGKKPVISNLDFNALVTAKSEGEVKNAIVRQRIQDAFQALLPSVSSQNIIPVAYMCARALHFQFNCIPYSSDDLQAGGNV